MMLNICELIMKPSLLNKFLNEKNEVSRTAYEQRNYWVNLLRKTKQKYFAGVNINLINDNKNFRQTV